MLSPHPIHQFVHAPEPLRWFTSLTPLAIVIILALVLPIAMFLINAACTGQFAYPHWHAFAWGDGLAVLGLGFFATLARDAWNGGNQWYVSTQWFLAWIGVGVIVTVLNAINDHADNGSWSKVINSPFAVYHIVIIAVCVTLIGSMSGAAIVAHCGTWVGLAISFFIVAYLASVGKDIYDKKKHGKRGGYGDAAFPVDEADPDATDGDPDTPTDAAA